MPELPEVETVRRGLEPVLEGARLSRVRINRPDLRFPFPERFVERLEGATVLRIDRRAKYLLMRLSTGETWVTHGREDALVHWCHTRQRRARALHLAHLDDEDD